MKKYYSILMAAVLVGLAACAKQEAQIDTPEDAPVIVAEDLVVFTATDGEAKTKSEIAGDTGKFTWNDTDRIAIHTTDGYKLSETAVVDGEDAGLATFTVDKEGADINGFALSPYTLVFDDTKNVNSGSADSWGEGGGALVVNLPGTYTLADITDDKSPIPAIAVNEDGDLHFKQLGALLRVTLNNLPPSTRSVTIDFNGKKVWGAFTISSPTPGTSQIETSAIGVEDTHDIITINTPTIKAWTNNKVVNIPVPIGTYTTITVTSWNAADGGGTATLTMTRYIKVISGEASNWTPSRHGARKVIASLPVFSIGEGGGKTIYRVQIAPSNLIRTGSAWALHANAYDTTFGLYTEHIDGTYDEHTTGNEEVDNAAKVARNDAIKAVANRDLFQWAELEGASFGELAGHSDWRFGNRFVQTIGGTTRSSTRYVRVILPASEGFPNLTLGYERMLYNPTRYMGGTSGVFYFPDKWDDSLNTTKIELNKNVTTWPFVVTNPEDPEDATYYANTDLLDPEITMDVFNQLLNAGAVFIPSSGAIYASGFFSGMGYIGGTWTSDEKSSTMQYVFYHNLANISGGYNIGKTQYRSARLVRDIN